MTSSPLPPPHLRRIKAAAAVATLVTAAALSASVPAVADGGSTSPGSGTGNAGGKPTIVLVHGAYVDASSWNGVVGRLQSEGYRVIAPANPLRGLPTDSAYIASVLRSVKGPIVLVGHSYAGAVITEAAAGNPQVKSLVYVAAFMPDKGETLGQLAAKFPGSELNPALVQVPFTNADGSTGTDLYVSPDKFRAVAAADLPQTATSVAAAAQRPIAATAFTDKATSAAWRTIPSWAAVATNDKAIAPDLERFEAKRAGSHTVEINASHSVMISHPDAITDLIRDAAGAHAPSPALADTGLTTLGLVGAAAAGGMVVTGVGLIVVSRKRSPRTR
ncbi:alpha/beta fold hydrolase [Streptomyces sp. NPDC091209]|uniref:alpha/beta fold hydrolase n=1 Tax=Streptomyces sp. NPDC091209 TaxID=3365974 RepID=UPI0037F1253C